jgi:uncharacterized cupin superfamily protein
MLGVFARIRAIPPYHRRRMGPVHWDEATSEDLGDLAGSVELVLARRRTRPGQGCVVTEELAYVAAGEGRASQAAATYGLRAGDCLVRRPGAAPHTLVAGDAGLEVLAFGERRPAAQEGAPAQEGAGHLVALGDVAPQERRRGRTSLVLRDLGRAGGSARTGLKHVAIAPGAESMPPHAHSAEEELFVVLEGDGTLLLGDDEHAVRPGSVVARPAGSRVAHAWRAGERGLVFLAHGQRDPRDVCWYPRSHKLYVRGVGVMFRVDEPLGYWDGEE